MATLESLIEPFGVPFVYSIPPTALRRMEREIAEAAVTDVLTRMLGEAERESEDVLEGSGYPPVTFREALVDFIREYLPTPAPTADERETE